MSSNPDLIARRTLLQMGGLAGASLLGSGLLGCGGGHHSSGSGGGPSDADVLNFALNLEYLEASYYSLGITGAPLSAAVAGGSSAALTYKANPRVNFDTPAIRANLAEIADDETKHVSYLRANVPGAVERPAINLLDSFNAVLSAASNGAATTFDPFANELSFLLGAFFFEDVGVTAYHGSATLLRNPAYLNAAAGNLAVEAYHASTVRLLLAQRGDEVVAGTSLTVFQLTDGIATLRSKLDGNFGTSSAAAYSKSGDDQGIDHGGNVVPADANSQAFSRTTSQVLPIVYLGNDPTTTPNPNCFFPSGMNGTIR